jgi:hypothetical protein
MSANAQCDASASDRCRRTLLRIDETEPHRDNDRISLEAAVIERTGKGTGPGNDERIEKPEVQIDDQLASLWAYFTLTRAGETKIDRCGTNLFLLRKGPDGWKVFQIAATSRTEGCRPIAK